jgi:hypothetical protein
MGRRLTAALAATGLLILAISGIAGGHASSGIRGVLLDTTCAGACTPCAAASPCPPPCPPCTTQICPQRSTQDAAIACPASSSICTGCAPQSQPYTGPDAHLVVRRVSNGDVVARRAPTDGNFKIRLAPGHYRVHGFVSESCWQGETQKLAVRSGSFTALSLAVHNNCVVTPQRLADR